MLKASSRAARTVDTFDPARLNVPSFAPWMILTSAASNLASAAWALDGADRPCGNLETPLRLFCSWLTKNSLVLLSGRSQYLAWPRKGLQGSNITIDFSVILWS